MRIYVTGASGLVGRRLVRRLTERGDEVVALTRDRAAAEAAGIAGPRVELVKGDMTAPMGAWRESVAGCDAVVNLAGEPIFGRRWTDEQKARIRESRIGGTRMVVAAFGGATDQGRPKLLVSASAVGYYGSRADDKELAEDAHPGGDFLAKLCVDWEEAARGATAYGTRVVVLRTGIVLDPEGGALAEMLPLFRRFLGGPIGAGMQWFPWIHAEDEVGIIMHALDHPEARGPINATAPNPVRMKEFAKTLGAVLHRPAWFKAPEFAIRLRFGEAADVLIGGQRVVPAAAKKLGYAFRFPELRPALEDLVGAGAAAAT